MASVADIARREYSLGIKEPQAFDKYAGGRNEHWCAHFASWVYLQAGLPLPGYRTPSAKPPAWNPIASVNTMFETLDDMGAIYGSPQIGDLIFYYRSGSSGDKGHVGIVTELKDGEVVSIEGNLSNRIARVTHKLSDPKIAGYGRPYAQPASPLTGLLVLVGSVLITKKLIEARG
jgi:hypothetical protein